jgi:hypothetical protein
MTIAAIPLPCRRDLALVLIALALPVEATEHAERRDQLDGLV